MPRTETFLKSTTGLAAGIVGVACILPTVVGAGSLGVLGAVLAGAEAAAIGVAAVAGAALIGYWALRRRAHRRFGHGIAAADPGAGADGPACDLDAVGTAAERQAHETNAERLLTSVTGIREVADGYAFRLPTDAATLTSAASFLASERLCCPFYDFTLAVEREHGPAWLTITGGDGVKRFLRAEMVTRIEAVRPDLAGQADGHAAPAAEAVAPANGGCGCGG